MIISLTGCGNNSKNDTNTSVNSNNTTESQTTTNNDIKEDNQELVDVFNNAFAEVYQEAKAKGFLYGRFDEITDKLKENGINKYKALAICNKEFKEKVEVAEFVYDEKNIPNYDGKCYYDSIVLTDEKNSPGTDKYILVSDDQDNYYSVKISFKKEKFTDEKNIWYPTFSNSILLK